MGHHGSFSQNRWPGHHSENRHPAPGAMQPRNFGEGPKKWLEARAKGMGSMLKGDSNWCGNWRWEVKSAGIRWQNHRKDMWCISSSEFFLHTIFAFGQYKSVGFEGTIEPTNPTCRFIIHKYWGPWQGHVHWKRSLFFNDIFLVHVVLF